MANQLLVITIVGPDRRGTVANISDIILKQNGGIEESKMARLGGEFAVILLVSVPDENKDALLTGLSVLEDLGFSIIAKPTSTVREKIFEGFIPYEISVVGADHIGIVHRIAEHLMDHQIQIETMNTDVVRAPVSGTPLFTMDAMVQAPPEITLPVLRQKLQILGDELMVDIEVTVPVL